MNIRLLLLCFLARPILAAEAASTNGDEFRRLQEESAENRASLQIAWADFDVACRSGNVEAVARKCDDRIVKWLSGQSLSIFLGDGWKIDSLTIKRRVIHGRLGKYRAVALIYVEVLERGAMLREPTLQAMWWVLSGSDWRCLNLPFERTILPPTITFPFFCNEELTQFAPTAK